MRLSTPTGSRTGSRPKTRTEPVVARNSPSRCLRSVVLPAPLAPTRPYTRPAAAWNDTPSRAVLPTNDRERSLTSTICPMLFLHVRRFGGGSEIHGRFAFADHPEDVVGSEVQLVRLGQQGIDALLDDAAPFPERQLLAPFRDERSGAAAHVNDSRALQFLVRLHDRVRRHLQLQRQCPVGRELFAGLEQP